MAIIQGTDNPDIIDGTPENDEINALKGDDTIFGSAGNDTINGGEGSDTLDLKNLNVPITATFTNVRIFEGNRYPTRVYFDGTITSDLGTINSIDNQTIIAPEGQNNTIDQSKSESSQQFPQRIDLEKGEIYANIPFGGSAKFQNFNNAIGNKYNDFIDGNSANNNLIGNGYGDRIDGKDGDDTLLGTSSQARGVREEDTLTGGSGNDKFILGDANGAYYKTNGNDDFASITDFGSGDLIQLGTGDTYRTTRTDAGFDLFVTTGGANELIANVSRVSTGSTQIGITSTSDILSALPEGDFTLASSENLGGIFQGA